MRIKAKELRCKFILFEMRKKILEEDRKDIEMCDNLRNSDTYVKDVCHIICKLVLYQFLYFAFFFATGILRCIALIVKPFKGNKI